MICKPNEIKNSNLYNTALFYGHNILKMYQDLNESICVLHVVGNSQIRNADIILPAIFAD